MYRLLWIDLYLSNRQYYQSVGPSLYVFIAPLLTLPKCHQSYGSRIHDMLLNITSSSMALKLSQVLLRVAYLTGLAIYITTSRAVRVGIGTLNQLQSG